jgi:hypothetical protein
MEVLQRGQQDALNDAEHRGIGTDTEGESEYSDGGKPRRSSQHSNPIFQILPERLHGSSLSKEDQARVTSGIICFSDADELGECGASDADGGGVGARWPVATGYVLRGGGSAERRAWAVRVAASTGS